MEQLDDITWFGHASFCFTDKSSSNTIYYIDPFDLPKKPLEKADLIFITHAHSDHFSPPDLQVILKDETVIIAPVDILEKLELPQNQKVAVSPNQAYEVKGFSFITIAAYNNHPARLQAHPKENNWVGYIFIINDKKIYHAGDTDFIPEMNTLTNMHLDIALLPIGGKFTMDVNEAAQAANVIAAKITVPMHYKRLLGDSYKKAEETLKKEVTNSKVVILKELR